MGFTFINSGALTTVQDRGRMGHQRFGFHVSGAMDKHAFEIANALLDNERNAAVLEFALLGPEIRFDRDTMISITGADFQPMVNGKAVPMYRALQVFGGDVLKFGYCRDGVWGYIGFAGGIDVPVVMGSRSTDIKSEIGGYEGKKLEKGIRLKVTGNEVTLPTMDKRFFEQPVYKRDITTIRVVLGPQDDYFTRKSIETFLSQEYTITPMCDRMGYKVHGEIPLEHNEKGADIISDGIAYGSIQVPTDGQLIVLLADRQTTGGYTKIATLIGRDIPEFVQRRPGEKIKFKAVSPEEAQRLYLEDEQELTDLRNRINPPVRGLKGWIRKLLGN